MNEALTDIWFTKPFSSDECLEAVTILTKLGGTVAMKESAFNRLRIEGDIPSEKFFEEVKNALIVVGAVRVFGFSKRAEDYLLLHMKRGKWICMSGI